MRIALIAAGAGGMYCGSCLRDNTLARALLAAGHQTALIPTYTPLRTDEPDASIGRIFYGGINVYLQQLSGLFRHTPRWFDRAFDSIPLLRIVTRRAGDADPRKLARLTESILRGESGRQRKELDRLVAFLRDSIRPEIVNLPDEFFLGMAAPIRRALDVPVVCSLTGGDVFLDEMRDADRERIKSLVRERANDVGCFIATSAFYADYMAEYYGLERSRICVVPIGIDIAGFAPAASRVAAPSRAAGMESPEIATSPSHTRNLSLTQDWHFSNPESSLAPAHLPDATGNGEYPDHEAPTIGYLARICPQKGLHILAEAFIRLRRTLGVTCRLRAAGYLAGRFQPYLTEIRGRLSAAGCGRAFEYLGELDRPGKQAFLRSLTVFSVPTTFLEPKGIYALEAMAAGVPIVQPSHGVFPELLVSTGGGLLVPPGDVDALAQALKSLLQCRERRSELGARGQAAIHADRTAATMAARTLEVYEQMLRRAGAR